MFELYKFEKPKLYQNNIIINILWYLINNLYLNSCLPSNKIKIFLLKIFGAKIDSNVIIKQYVKIKFPWNLQIGKNSWIGEGVWIDNIKMVDIKENCCISQGVYFCTGNHNYKKKTFDLTAKEITIGQSCWIGAKSTIGPGINLKSKTFIKLGSIITKNFKND
jgi:putative colanic acid biosynthesis acetyltransferase WcaF